MNFEKVMYYTVQLEGKEISEFRDFQQRLSLTERDRLELNEIRVYIQQIGMKWGAKPSHFRNEREADGLPPSYHFFETEGTEDFGLRLYCIRLCDEIVILLNGDRKTQQKAQACTNCKVHFELANKIARSINTAIADGDIWLDTSLKEIVIAEEDFELNI